MDRISKSLLDEFSTDAALEKLPEDSQFEHFAAFLALSRHHAEAFNPSDLVTGDGNDTGIDAVAILVNGSLVLDPDEVKELAETNGYVDASFIFVQAERSSHFESAKIRQFGFGVKDFFSETPRLQRNDHIAAAAQTMAAVYTQSSKFRRGKPDCRMYYVTTGRWTGDQDLEAHRAAAVDDLVVLNIFRHIDFVPVDAA